MWGVSIAGLIDITYKGGGGGGGIRGFMFGT